MPSAPVDDTTRSFEESLGELESRVRALEAGDLPLEAEWLRDADGWRAG